MREAGEGEFMKPHPSVDVVDSGCYGQVFHVDSCLEEDVMIKDWCSKLLM